MTTIKKVHIHGFKSFAKSTEIFLEKDFSAFLGPNGSGKCLIGDSLVQLGDGSLIKIKELVEDKSLKNRSKEIEDGIITIGDSTEVSYLDLNDLKVKSKKILAYVKRKSPETLVKITTQSGRHVTSTKYHPLFILKEGKIISIKAEDLKVGTRIVVPRNIELNEKNKCFVEILDIIKPEDNIYAPYDEEYISMIKRIKKSTWKNLAKELELSYSVLEGFLDKQPIKFAHLVKILRKAGLNNYEIIEKITKIKAGSGNKIYDMVWENSPEFSRFLGYLLSGGRLPSKHDQILFTNDCEEVVADYIRLARRLFGVNPSLNEYKPDCYDVLIYSEPIRILLNKFGMPLGNIEKKEITNLFLMHSTKHELAELLNGLFCGDAYIGNGYIEIATKSNILGFIIENILLRLGIFFSSEYKIKIAANRNFSGVYRIIGIYGADNLRIFNDQITLIHPEKRNKLLLCINKKISPNFDLTCNLACTNDLVKKISKELRLDTKKLKQTYPKLESYIYNEYLTSRAGLNKIQDNAHLNEDVKSNDLQQIIQLANSDIFLDEIITIEEIKSNEEWVYDLSVENDHNFIANNIIVHNSNVTDAICFVLGRLSSKSMRVEKASHLIYNGGKKNNPAKNAVVSIVFDNSDKQFPISSKEIVISRSVNQNGNSTYRINDEVRTRQQVLELLAAAKINPDGHNIVLQGDIVRFMEMKTEERREVIEDIAGISVYEEKKQKAMSELEKVQQKLTQADIILTEREANLRELRKDRDQAKKYKDLELKIKDNKATFLSIQIKERQEKIQDLEKSLSDIQSKVSNFTNKINEHRQKISKNREEIKNIHAEIEEKGEKEQLLLRKEIDDLRASIIRSNSRIETLQGEIKKIDERKLQLKLSIQQNEGEIKAIKTKKKSIEEELKNFSNEESNVLKEINSFKVKHDIRNLDDSKDKIDSIEKNIESLSQNQLRLQEEKQEIIRNRDKIEFQIQNIDEQINKFKNLEAENKQKSSGLEKSRQEFKRLTVELSKSLNEDSAYSAQLSKARKSLLEANEEHARLRARHIGIKEHLAQDSAVRKILGLKQKGVYGTVAELGTVPGKYSLALEVAAGPRINSIVVENDEIAAKCINILKESRSGIATFLPLNKIRPRVSEDFSKISKDGNLGLAINLVKFDAKFKNVFSFVFGSTIVVNNIDIARRIGVGRIRMVTLDGDLLEVSGAMIGGFRSRQGIGFSQDEVTKKINELESETSRLTSIVTTIESKKIENEERIIRLRQDKANLEAEIIKIEKSLGVTGDLSELKKHHASLLQQKKEAEIKIKEILNKIDYLFKEIEKSKKERTAITSKITQNPELNKDLSLLEEKRVSIKEKILELKNEINNLDNQIEKIFLPEIEKTNKIIKEQDKECSLFSKELSDLSIIVKNKELELKEKNRLEKESYGKFKDMSIKRNKLSEDIQRLESLIIEEQDKSKSQEIKINDLNIKRASLVAEIEGMNKEFEQYKEGKIRKTISLDELKSEIKEFEKMILNLGNVNLRALEVYDNLEKEHKELVDKSAKLKIEKEDVLNMMNEIEIKKKDIFLNTFSKINTKFKEIFNSLSTKGEAYLELENKEDPLEAGVDIKVRLVGNKFLDIKSLSGGEKTLTALSFIFSIQEYDPASFYLFDEVDASLDKTNSELLSKLISKYSSKAQYIVISHNDTIINEANQIYGVTMQDGISKVISLKL